MVRLEAKIEFSSTLSMSKLNLLSIGILYFDREIVETEGTKYKE